MSQFDSHRDHPELDALAHEYLSNCYPVDLTGDDDSHYGVVADGLTPEGMDRASEVRTRVMKGLSTQSYTGADLIARNQLYDWVSAEHDLMESGEKYRRLFEIEAPHYRIAQSIRASLAADDVDWLSISNRLDAMAACLRHLSVSLQHGLDHGVVATREEVLNAIRRYRAITNRAEHWVAVSIATGRDVSLKDEALARAAGADVVGAAGDLVEFLERSYLSRTSEQIGIGSERYSLWCRKLLGEDMDLIDLYDSIWQELVDTQAQLSRVAAVMSSGGSARDLIWELDSSIEYEVDASDGIRHWVAKTAKEQQIAVDEALVPVPAAARDFSVVDGGAVLPDVMEVLPPARLGGRPATMLVRTLNNVRISTLPYLPLIRLQTFPGEHLFNSYLGDPGTDLRYYQRLLVSHVSQSGWMSYSAMLAATEIGKNDDLQQLNALRNRIRELVTAIGDIGRNLGLNVSSMAPQFVGEQWTDEVFTQMIAQMAYWQREFAKNRMVHCAMNPGYSLGPVVGSRIRAEALETARSAAGTSFDLRAYHDRTLRIAPTGAPGLRAQLADVGTTVQH